MKKTIYIMIMLLTAFIISACVEVDVSEVTSVSLNFTPKDAYLVDEPVVLDDMELSVVFESGENQTLSLDDADIELTGAFLDSGTTLSLDTTTSGEKSLAVSYQGVAATVTFNVYDTIVTTAGYTSDYVTGFVENLINPLHSAYVATSAGGRVFVSSGTYTESTLRSGTNRNFVLDITKNTTWIAGDDVLLDPTTPVERFFNIFNTTAVTIDGFVLSDDWTQNGIVAYGANTQIINNFVNAPANVAQNGNSIQISGSNSVVNGNTVYGTNLLSNDWAGSSILISPYDQQLSDIEVTNNTVIREVGSNTNNMGIVVSDYYSYGISNVDIDNNRIVGAHFGVVIQSANNSSAPISSITVTNNEFIDVQNYTMYMGQFQGSTATFTDIVITDNVFDNTDQPWYGPLVLLGSSANVWSQFDWNAFIADNDLGDRETVLYDESEYGYGFETYFEAYNNQE